MPPNLTNQFIKLSDGDLQCEWNSDIFSKVLKRYHFHKVMLQVLTLLIQIATIESDICMQDTPNGRHCFRSYYVPGTDFKFTKLSSLWFLKSLLLVGFGIFFPLKIRFTGTFSQKWLSLFLKAKILSYITHRQQRSSRAVAVIFCQKFVPILTILFMPHDNM